MAPGDMLTLSAVLVGFELAAIKQCAELLCCIVL